MSTAATTPANPILDLAQPLAERQLARLERLAEMGMEIAAAVRERAAAAPAEADLSWTTLAFARVSKAVRLTDLLQTKIVADLDHQLRLAAHRADQAQAQDQRVAEDWAKAHVERAVERLAKAKHADDDDAVDRIVAECGERLDFEDHGWILARPVGEIVAGLCQDLDLELDWSVLEDLGWVREQDFQTMRPPPFTGEVARRDGVGIPPPLSWETTCVPPPSPSNAPDG